MAAKSVLLIAFAAALFLVCGCAHLYIHGVADKPGVPDDSVAQPIAPDADSDRAEPQTMTETAESEANETSVMRTASADATATRARITLLQKRRDALTREIAALKRKRDQLTKDIEALNAHLSETKTKRAAEVSEIARITEELRTLSAERDQLRAEVAERARTKATVEKGARTAEQHLAERREQLKQLETQIAELDAERKRREQALAEFCNLADKVAGDAARRGAELKRATQKLDQLLNQKRKQLEDLEAAGQRMHQAVAARRAMLAALDAQVKSKGEELARIRGELDETKSTAGGGEFSAFHLPYAALLAVVVLVPVIATAVALKRNRPRECRLLLEWRSGTASVPQQACLHFNPRIEEVRLTASGPESAPIGEATEHARLRVQRGRLRLIHDGPGLTVRRNDEAAAPPLSLKVGDDIVISDGNDGDLRIVIRDFERVAESEEAEELTAAVEAAAQS